MGNLLSSVKYTSDGVPYYTLKDFELEEQVGSGGYGTVLKVSELNIFALKKRIVAVKLFKVLDIYSHREIQILKTCTHAHIVQLLGVIWDEKDKDDPTKKPIYTGYVMEYIQLGSLHKEIHDLSKSYDIALILLWVKQIGSGLHYLHGNGIIHRDVKPSNILLLRIDHIKLADFRLARNISYQQTYTERPIGSDPYMAPEIVGEERDYGAPADVYSVGVTIWEIICRKDPSKHLKTSTDSSGIVSTELIMDADETYGGLTDLVKRCWQREISDRPSIKEIINFEPKFDQTILVMGGDSDNNKMTLWNRKASTWTVSQMELPRRPDGVVYLDDELYIISDDKSLSKLDKNMEWKQLADMDERRGDIKNTCLGWNGYIWVFGGWKMDRGALLKSVERYDPKEDKWALMPVMKYGRRGAAAAVCNGKIYICGGYGFGVGVNWKSVECFDPESGVWTELTDMPTPRCYHSLVCYRNKLVVLGGIDGEEDTTTVLELDPFEENGQWKELSPLTSPSFASAGVVLGREIFAIGWDNTNDRSTSVQIFDGINWRVGPSFPLNAGLIPSAVLVSQEFADRLSCYPNDLKQ